MRKVESQQHVRTSADTNALRNQLNPTQCAVLRVCEYFGWRLREVQCRQSQAPLPILCAGEGCYATIRPDGKVDEWSEAQARS